MTDNKRTVPTSLRHIYNEPIFQNPFSAETTQTTNVPKLSTLPNLYRNMPAQWSTAIQYEDPPQLKNIVTIKDDTDTIRPFHISQMNSKSYMHIYSPKRNYISKRTKIFKANSFQQTCREQLGQYNGKQFSDIRITTMWTKTLQTYNTG